MQITDETRYKLATMAYGAALNGSSTVFGHPLDLIKILRQTTGESYQAVMRQQLRRHGVVGFWAGLSPNLIRQSTKSGPRTYLYLTVPSWFDAVRQRSALAYSIGSGGTIAIFDSVLQALFDRTKIKIISDSYQQKVHQHVWNVALINPRELIRGASIGYIKTSIAWASFFYFRERAINMNKKTDSGNTLSYSLTFITSFVTSIVKIIITNPLDVTRSNMIAGNIGIRSAVLAVYKAGGFAAFYRSMGIRFLHGMGSAVIGNMTLDFHQSLKK